MSFDTLRNELLELQEQKKRNEDEAMALLDELNSPGADGSPPVGLTGNLVDEEGFPRADIDIPRIRKHRNRLAILKTDRKTLEAQIEDKLHALHEAQRNAPDDDDDNDDKNGDHQAGRNQARNGDALVEPAQAMRLAQGTQGEGDDLVPLALVNEVFAGSPAEQAGLEEGDRIVQFGSVSYLAGSPDPRPDLSAFAAEASSHFEQPIAVRVFRGDATVPLELVPRRWEGHGVLGCHIVPL
ncbi:26S proteasome non-ATPase regulatory subunit 9 [Hondaea fermentalgiana]|uniref:26S proteasome non-ATPase regulatory subunit 9 n=1 Tax=Hondaea fermentalgiana TaxID=2315210 RepID=A0A2R5H376_9STRA|nr:26S proteasome non-ATPase regulatory subunit 9 [Hondaea fermentalgiana]|eukprot:GBG34864.1 26S proteasome non-ATPase regulatory subunit 9 [Hondaea fermentalgiana]